MLTSEQYHQLVKEHSRDAPRELFDDFEALETIHVDLPAGEQAYWTVPRTDGGWRLPNNTTDELVMLPMRSDEYNPNAYLAVLPQPIIMHAKVAAVLEDRARRLFEHHRQENSLAQREHDVPMLISRFDVIVDKAGDIQICELDDAPSLWPAMPEMNPIAESYLNALEDQLGLPVC